MKGIFDGLRVLDFSNVLSGPTLTRLLTEMGADVIKVELPPGGDIGRVLPWVRDGRSGYHVQHNRGKRSLFCDVKNPQGKELIDALLPSVDVVVQNFSPGAFDRMGFTWEGISAINPRTVLCSISAFGTEGPLASEPGYDPIVQAYSGVMHMNGEPDRAPVLIGLSPGDVMTGLNGLIGVVSALYHRMQTDRGQHVEVSLLDTYLAAHEINYEAWSTSGGTYEPRRTGAVHPLVGGCGVFATPDGAVSMAVVTDNQWAGMCEAMGQPDLATDPRFAAAAGRSTNRDEMNELIRTWCALAESRDRVVADLKAQRVPVAPVLEISEAAQHPHMRQHRSIRSVPDPVLGEIDIPGMPIKFSEFPEELPLETAWMGEHNEEIVRTDLGWDEQRYDALVQAGVLINRPES